MKHDYEQIKLMIKAIGMIPAHDLGDFVAFYAPDRTFKVAVVLLDKKEVEEEGGYRVIHWDELEPFDLTLPSIEIAATETRKSFTLDMPLFSPMKECVTKSLIERNAANQHLLETLGITMENLD